MNRWAGKDLARRAVLAVALLGGCAVVPTPSGSDGPSGTARPSPSTTELWAAHPQPSNPMSEADRAAIDAAATAALALSDGATALYVGIWNPEKGFYLQAYGESSHGVPAALGDHSRIGSVTKTFTATAVLELVARGQISLDDTVGELLPELTAEFPVLATVTVKQLLGMRTGIGDFFCCPGSLVETYFADPSQEFTVNELIASGLQFGSPSATPLASSDYSSTNYLILGEILRAVTGRSAGEVVTDVARAAGLQQTALSTGTMPEPATHGYLGAAQVAEHHDLLPEGTVAGTDVSGWSVSFAGPAGGMYSTLGDLGAWAASGFGSALLPVDLADERLTPPDGREYDYGYGITVYHDWIGHSGLVEGWIVDTAFNTTTGATWVLVVNSGGGEAVLQGMAAFAQPN